LADPGYRGSLLQAQQDRDRDAGPVELTTQHFGGDWHAKHIASELNVGLQVVDIGGAFEDLYDSALATDFKNLTLSKLAVTQSHV
jgi:hypothetical protein